ncbi:MAG: hypothetical protein H0X63_08175 [Flavobacteriales bacterium]|nr:hypothetical protein [Flavobacteriales bacterium]
MRVFTQDEQRLLTRIRDGQGPNLYSLIDHWISGVSFQVDTTIDSVDFIFEAQGFNFHRLQEIQTIVIQAVNLLKLFEDKGYIFTFINANQLPPNPFTFGQAAINVPTIPYHFPDPRISKMFCEYSIREIFVTPELDKFINDGFITREEGRANRQWFTTKIALKVAIAALLLNMFFNILNIWIKYSDNHPPANTNAKNQTARPESKVTSDTTIVSDTVVKITTIGINSKIDTIKK